MADHCRSVLRMVGRIFDDVARVDVRPAHEEDSFTFLNRVATPYWTRVRDFVDETFATYPSRARWRAADALSQPTLA